MTTARLSSSVTAQQADSNIDVDVLAHIGNTPLVKLQHLFADTPHTVYAKLEFLNPSGSVKDRIGRSMLDAAEEAGGPGGGQLRG